MASKSRMAKAYKLLQAIKKNPKAKKAFHLQLEKEFPGLGKIGDGTIIKLILENPDAIIKIIEAIAKLFML